MTILWICFKYWADNMMTDVIAKHTIPIPTKKCGSVHQRRCPKLLGGQGLIDLLDYFCVEDFREKGLLEVQ